MSAAATPIVRTRVDAESAALFAGLRKSRPVPLYWRQLDRQRDGALYVHRAVGLRVIESIQPYRATADGDLYRVQRWHHVSVSRRSRLPDWEDMKLVRRDFIGDDRECYQVFPPESRWVSDNDHVLHLWCSMERPDGVLPDFRIAGTI